MKPIRLSICIPTLNRAAFIGETLKGIVSQATDEVEIVVVDGASTDNTGEVVGKIAAQFPRLRYHRLEKRGGFDNDLCKTVELAQGDYCWLFTDDDLIKPGAVAAVLEAARKDYSLIVVNAEVRTPDLAVCLQARRIPGGEDRIYQPTAAERDRLFAETATYLSFLGGVVIRRDVWNQREKAKYIGTDFMHMCMTFQSVLPGQALLLSQPWVIIRYGNAIWTWRSFEVWMFLWPQLVWMLPGVADWAKKRVEAREPWRSYRRLLIARGMGQYSLKDYDRWLKPRITSPLRRALTRAIAALPFGPLNLFGRFCARLIGKGTSIGMYDLRAAAAQARKE